MTLNRLHRWLGLALSGLLLVISITGIMLVWKPEYQRLTINQSAKPLATQISAQASVLEVILSAHSNNSVRLIQIHPGDIALYKVFLPDKQYAWYDQAGRLVETWQSNGRLEDWLLDLHHRFLLGNTIGLNMAGFSGLLLMPLVLIGFYQWWPRRRTLKQGLFPKGKQRGRYLLSHGNIGGVSVLPFLLIAISGVILVYPVEAGKVLLPGYAQRAKPHIVDLSAGREANSIVEQFRAAKAYFPDARIRWYRPPNADYAQAIVGLQQANSLNRQGKSTVHFEHGRAVQTTDALRQPVYKRLFDFMFPLHTGMLPVWYRIFLTLFGAGLALVCSFGIVSWLKRGR